MELQSKAPCERIVFFAKSELKNDGRNICAVRVPYLRIAAFFHEIIDKV